MNWYQDIYGVYKRVQGREVGNKHGEFYKCMEEIIEEPFVPVKFWAECDVDRVDCFEEAVDQCICSKHIKQLCVLIHKPSLKRIQVGCVCVKKDCGKQLKKQINKGIKNAQQYRKCVGCNEKCIPIDKPLYQTVCKTCYSWGFQLENRRECQRCRTKSINRYDPNWKKICKECYYTR